ncbi:MAG: Kae1-associated kinase Bud32 [Candidatus Thorarchaeota archaeon]
MSAEVWAVGAESEIYRVRRWGIVMAVKSRVSKPYLLADIDNQLKRLRTTRECSMLQYARRLGVPTPTVYSIDLSNCRIWMDFIDGRQLKQLANEVSKPELRRLCESFGVLIGMLHRGNVVHGDPTTSNVIVDSASRMWIVDFGLGEYNATIEMKGVDLHLIERAIETTHWDLSEDMLSSILDGYVSVLGSDADENISRMKHLRLRGRYH